MDPVIHSNLEIAKALSKDPLYRHSPLLRAIAEEVGGNWAKFMLDEDWPLSPQEYFPWLLAHLIGDCYDYASDRPEDLAKIDPWTNNMARQRRDRVDFWLKHNDLCDQFRKLQLPLPAVLFPKEADNTEAAPFKHDGLGVRAWTLAGIRAELDNLTTDCGLSPGSEPSEHQCNAKEQPGLGVSVSNDPNDGQDIVVQKNLFKGRILSRAVASLREANFEDTVIARVLDDYKENTTWTKTQIGKALHRTQDLKDERSYRRHLSTLLEKTEGMRIKLI